MIAGPINTSLTLYRPVQTAAGGGFTSAKSTVWEEAGRIPAERIRVNARSVAENAEAWPDYTPAYRIRLARREIAEGWRVAERGDVAGRRYAVVNIVTDRALGMQTLFCERVNL